MIKFFRKIRQNLLMENKTGKYLKYAIGEIILVVIGILIALQVNNWNEQRKIKSLLSDYKESLLTDLNQDIIVLKQIIEEAKKDSLKQVKIARRLSSKYSTIDTLKVIVQNDLSWSYRIFRTPNRNTLLAMQNNGIIESFDKKTYDYLINLQTSQNISEDIIKAQALQFQNQVDKFLTKYSSLGDSIVIGGPLYENKWKNVDENELFNHVEAIMLTKNYMNTQGNIIRRRLLSLTKLTRNHLFEQKKKQ
ncbi:MAG: hypothetical protein BM563_09875 [Bacteroidetes bacterium MedPE-SWsnd-G1]|nr:MAG: hypothetical protein BM563_09875 [Bacteroidetes bacterium MedPE-SWsnd-G1]